MIYKVGQFITLPADDVLGCEVEEVEILEIYEDSMWVKQTTEINGEIGEFEVSLPDLVTLGPG